jgi:hypothetical protein
MEIPDFLKNDRWVFYTKTMGFDNKKAKEFISRVDKSLKSQFTAKVEDVKGLL